MSSVERTWKEKLSAAKRLYAGWQKTLHKLVGQITEFWLDADFRAECGLRDDGDAADWLDAEFPELPLHWLDMLAVYREYPQPQQWVDARPQDLLDSIRQKAEQEGESAPRLRISWKRRAAELQEEIECLREDIRRLQGENRELRKLVSQGEPVAA